MVAASGSSPENSRPPMEIVEPGTLIFVVDDETEVRASIADVLTVEGYEARPLPSCDAAWAEIIRGTRPAAILLDLWIPGMSSGEFVRRLRSSECSGVPVLVLSGSRSVGGIDDDVDAILQKPVEGTALVRAVDKLIRHRRRNVGGQSLVLCGPPKSQHRIRGKAPT